MFDRRLRDFRWSSPTVLTSLVALSAAVSSPAWSQTQTSYNAGDPTVVSGSVGFDRGATTSGTEIYTIDSATAVLDFTPFDTAIGGGPINFQNAGTTVIYTNGTAVTNFTVLNRITPADSSRQIQFDGTVISQLRNGQTTTPGGAVWFYSPGGIVLGSSAVFDVGSLLLTASDPTGGSGVIGAVDSFTGGGAPGARIDINAGATINASAAGSYVAMIAPAISMSGDVRINGSAAYVAAEEATVTINGGLFDIAVDLGTDTGGGFPLIHSGTTTGPAGGASTNTIYMVAVPKNDAITLLVNPTGHIGFDIATGATVANGRVVLSAGRNILAGAIDDAAPISTAPADVHILSGFFTTDVFVRATTNAYAASLTGTPDFAGDVYLRGGANAHLGARVADETMTIGGNVSVITDNGSITSRESGNSLVYDVLGGVSLIYADDGAAIDIGGDVLVSSNATAIAGSGADLRGTARAGTSSINVDGGTISIAGTAQVYATALGHDTMSNTPVDLYGGRASIYTAEGGGQITLNGFGNYVFADAISDLTNSVGNVTAGGGTLVAAANGVITFARGVDVTADAYGRTDSLLGGDGQGGNVFVQARDGGRISATGLNLLARGSASSAAGALGGGAGRGGQITLNASNGGTVAGPAFLQATGIGGTASGSGDGGLGFGGIALVRGESDFTLSRINASAMGTGGAASGAGTGGLGHGGQASVVSLTGDLVVTGNVSLFSDGVGGDSVAGDGGEGLGGGARISTRSGGGGLTINGATTMSADGQGGDGGLLAGTLGGRGQGGVATDPGNNLFDYGVYITAEGGDLSLNGGITFSADGAGGDGAGGGAAVGGVGYLQAFDNPLIVSGAVVGSVSGTGGDALSDAGLGLGGGLGGDGTGGEFYAGTFAQNGITGSLTTENLTLVALGAGGLGGDGVAGVDGGAGGNGLGGSIQLIANASSGAVTTGDLQLFSYGSGGDGGQGADGVAGVDGTDGGTGGQGEGGLVLVGVSSGANLPSNTGSLTFGTLASGALGGGGQGGQGGAGGNGLGSTVPGTPGGDGGDGGNGALGGAGLGGETTLIARGAPVVGGDVNFSAIGFGGSGGDAGLGGTGGNAPSGTPGGVDGVDGAGGVGGDATGGGVGILVTNRSQRTERGSLALGATYMSTEAFGGVGVLNGAAFAGQGLLQVVNGDAELELFNAFTSGEANPAGDSFDVEVANGVLQVGGDNMTINTVDASLNVRDGGVLRAGTLTFNGGTAGSMTSVAEGGVVGTPGLIDLTGGFYAEFGDAVAFDATLRTAGGTTIRAGGGTAFPNGGGIAVGDIEAGGSVFLNAGGGVGPTGGAVTAGNVTAGVDALIFGFDITLGDVTATNNVGIFGNPGTGVFSQWGSLSIGDVTSMQGSLTLTGGNIRAGDLSAAGSIQANTTLDLDPDDEGSIEVGDVAAGDNVNVYGADVTIGDVTGIGGISLNATANGRAAGDLAVGNVVNTGGNYLDLTGDTITTGDLSSQSAITIRGQSLVRLGNLQTPGRIDIQAIDPSDGSYGAIETGSLQSTGNAVSLLADRITTGDIDAAGNVSASGLLTDRGRPLNGEIRIGAVNAEGSVEVRGIDTRIGDISSGEMVLIDSLDIQAGDIDADALISIASLDGSASFGHVVQTGDLTSGFGVQVASDGGAIITGDVRSGYAISIDGFQGVTTGDLTGALLGQNTGSVTVNSDAGAITVGDVTGAEIEITQGYDELPQPIIADIRTGDLRAERISVLALGAVTVGDVSTGDDYEDIDVGDNLQTVIYAGSGDLITGDVDVADTLIMVSRTGSVTAGNLTAARSLVVLSDSGTTTLGDVSTGREGGDTAYIAGSFILEDALIAPYEEDFTLEGEAFDTDLLQQVTRWSSFGTTLQVGSISTGVLRTGADVSYFGDIDASTSMYLFSPTMIHLAGQVSAPDIITRSRDLDVGATASLGDTNTDRVAIDNYFSGAMQVGGQGQSDQQLGVFTLTDDEFSRVHANTITLQAYGGEGSASLILSGLTALGSASGDLANLHGDGASLNFIADTIRVEGAVGLSGSAATDALTLTAVDTLEIVTDRGGQLFVSGLGSDGPTQTASLTGTLHLSANVIAAGTNDILARLAEDTDFAGRDALLAAAAAEARPEGYIQAGRLEFDVGRLLAIQNSGTATLAAGFTAGAGGMVITTPDRQQAPGAEAIGPTVVVYGRILGENGVYLVNGATLDAVDLQPGRNNPFDPASTVNGCIIGDGCQVDTDQPGMIGTTVAALEEVLAASPTNAVEIPTIRFVRVVNQDGLITDTIITEPVSGAGNSSLWEASGEDGESENEDEGNGR